MKVKDLEGAALDWAVGVCEGMPPNYFDADDQAFTDDEGMLFCPSANWAQGGPIIEREFISVECDPANDNWVAIIRDNVPSGFVCRSGRTPLIAAMRCYVASKLGNEVEVPDEVKEAA